MRVGIHKNQVTNTCLWITLQGRTSRESGRAGDVHPGRAFSWCLDFGFESPLSARE